VEDLPSDGFNWCGTHRTTLANRWIETINQGMGDNPNPIDPEGEPKSDRWSGPSLGFVGFLILLGLGITMLLPMSHSQKMKTPRAREFFQVCSVAEALRSYLHDHNGLPTNLLQLYPKYLRCDDGYLSRVEPYSNWIPSVDDYVCCKRQLAGFKYPVSNDNSNHALLYGHRVRGHRYYVATNFMVHPQ
jgi:hypothetical protein